MEWLSLVSLCMLFWDHSTAQSLSRSYLLVFVKAVFTQVANPRNFAMQYQGTGTLSVTAGACPQQLQSRNCSPHLPSQQACVLICCIMYSVQNIHGYPDHSFGLQKMFSCHAWITAIYQWIYPTQAFEYITCKNTACKSRLPGASQEDHDSTFPSCYCT